MSRCPYKIRWTFGTDAQCEKPRHITSLRVEQIPDGRLVVECIGSEMHTAHATLPDVPGPGPVLNWQAGDRREFTGDWPGPCTKLQGCTLHTGHNGRCAP